MRPAASGLPARPAIGMHAYQTLCHSAALQNRAAEPSRCGCRDCQTPPRVRTAAMSGETTAGLERRRVLVVFSPRCTLRSAPTSFGTMGIHGRSAPISRVISAASTPTPVCPSPPPPRPPFTFALVFASAPSVACPFRLWRGPDSCPRDPGRAAAATLPSEISDGWKVWSGDDWVGITNRATSPDALDFGTGPRAAGSARPPAARTGSSSLAVDLTSPPLAASGGSPAGTFRQCQLTEPH